MKIALILLAAFTVTAVAEDEIIPTAWNKDRYKEMLAKSPFVLATPPEPDKKQEAKYFDNTYVKGVGTDYVIVQRVGDDHTIRLWGNTPDPESGVFVKEVKWSEQPGRTKVVVKKGDEEAEITFNENDLHAASPPPPGAGRPPGPPGTPGAAVPGGAMQRSSAFAPRTAVPQPAVQVPRPTASAIQAPQPAAQGNFNGARTNNSYGGNRSGFTPAGANAQQPRPNNDATGGRQRIRVIRQ